MTLLGELTEDEFMASVWQRRPLLVRGAFPGFRGFLDRGAVLELAEREDLPSRFVVEDAEGTHVQHGPFAFDDAALPKVDWTVLVQSIETAFFKGWDLLDHFRFLPRARLDDLMVSFAVEGGGIGPHFDLYDVFLIQGEGQRRWKYGASPLGDVDEDAASEPFPFEPDFDEVLHPGDMLYLPPRVPHEGTALTACTTYSVGGAAPSFAALRDEYLAFMTMHDAPRGLYADAGSQPPSARAAIPTALVSATTSMLLGDDGIVPTPGRMSEFLGRLLTGPKPHTLFHAPDERFSFRASAHLLPPSRALHDDDSTVFINGDAYAIAAEDWTFFKALTDERDATLGAGLPLTSEGLELLAHLHQMGAVAFDMPERTVDDATNVEGTTMNGDTKEFLSAATFAVAGASTNRTKYGNKVFQALVASGRETTPLNPSAEAIEGVQAFGSIADMPSPPVALSIVTPPAITKGVVDDAIAANVSHIWMQPGAEHAGASAAARDAGINVIDDGRCILVELRR